MRSSSSSSKKSLGSPGDRADARQEPWETLRETVESLGGIVGVEPACAALGFNRSRFYRLKQQAAVPEAASSPSRPRPPLSLTEGERQEVLDILRSERFMDQAPVVVHATLLEEGRYLCSVRTMYRILAGEDEVRERRNQKRHPLYQAGTAGHRAKPGVDLGHHQIEGADEVDMLLPVRHHGHLQPPSSLSDWPRMAQDKSGMLA